MDKKIRMQLLLWMKPTTTKDLIMDEFNHIDAS